MWIIQDEFAKRDHFSGNSGVLLKLNHPTHMHTFMYVIVYISHYGTQLICRESRFTHDKLAVSCSESENFAGTKV